MELLSSINNKINIDTLCDNKIAIKINSLEQFESIQNTINEYYMKYNKTVRVLDNNNYIANKNYNNEKFLKEYNIITCINIEEQVGDGIVDRDTTKPYDILIVYCDSKWYSEHGYKLIEKDDILWNY
jgi:hypothetical protein